MQRTVTAQHAAPRHSTARSMQRTVTAQHAAPRHSTARSAPSQHSTQHNQCQDGLGGPSVGSSPRAAAAAPWPAPGSAASALPSAPHAQRMHSRGTAISTPQPTAVYQPCGAHSAHNQPCGAPQARTWAQGGQGHSRADRPRRSPRPSSRTAPWWPCSYRSLAALLGRTCCPRRRGCQGGCLGGGCHGNHGPTACGTHARHVHLD